MLRSRTLRLWTVLWAALQIALPAVASIEDGRLATRAAFDSRPHVEDVTGSDCAPVHGADCALCKQLSSASLAERVELPPPPTGPRLAVRPGLPSAASRTLHALARPRAPPAIA